MKEIINSIMTEQKWIRDKIKTLIRDVSVETDWVKARAMYDEMVTYARRLSDLDTELKTIALIEAKKKRKELFGRLFKRTG